MSQLIAGHHPVGVGAGVLTPTRARSAAAVALAVTSGATDAMGYLTLGHVFTSAMTGNLVLLGISLGHHNGERAGRVVVSLLCFIVGCAVGARIAGVPAADDSVWPRRVTRALTVEAAVFAAYAVTWCLMDDRPTVAVKALLLGLGAIALGIQSATMQRFGAAGLNTTFLSGALMRLVSELVTGRRFRDVAHHLLLLAGLVGGGTVAALLVLHARDYAPVVQIVPLGAALAVGVFLNKSAGHSRSSA